MSNPGFLLSEDYEGASLGEVRPDNSEGYDEQALLIMNEIDGYKPSSAGEASFTFDLGTPSNFNSVGILGNTFLDGANAAVFAVTSAGGGTVEAVPHNIILNPGLLKSGGFTTDWDLGTGWTSEPTWISTDGTNPTFSHATSVLQETLIQGQTYFLIIRLVGLGGGETLNVLVEDETQVFAQLVASITGPLSVDTFIFYFTATRSDYSQIRVTADANTVVEVKRIFMAPVYTIDHNGVNAAWIDIGSEDPIVSQQFIVLNFEDLDSSTVLNGVQFGNVLEVPPFVETDWENTEATGGVQESAAGYFLGSNIESVMAEFRIQWPTLVTEDNSLWDNIITWKNGALKKLNSFFLIPDIDETDIHFVWFPKKGAKFSAPKKSKSLSQVQVAPITIRSRLADFIEGA